MDWLLDHQATAQFGLVLSLLVVMLAWETFLPRRAFVVPVGARWFNQVALTTLGSIAVRWCAPIAALSLAALAREEGWGLLNVVSLPAWLSVVLGVVAIDLGMYVQHRLYHAVPFLWRFHQIHHCDLDVDCGTALRHHPVETLITTAFDLAVIAVVGVPPLAVFIGVTLAAAATLFNHANIAIPQAADRALRWLLVTPDMHRIHHSADVGESNRNFANLFSWCDRAFSTYSKEPLAGQAQMRLGLDYIRGERDLSLWRLLALPFQRRGNDDAYSEPRLEQREASP